MTRTRRWLLLGALLAFSACSQVEPHAAAAQEADEASPASAAPERVETQRVAPGTIRTTMAASGSIRARRETAIGAEVGGRLAELFVDVGDSVEDGQPLFRIDPEPYEMALAEARAGLALARAESENAAQEAERVRKLVAQRAASEQHFDQLRTAASVARARVAQMEARLARSKRDLECTQVTAPYAGSIVERLAHEGSMAGPEPIVVLQETGALELVLAIPEAWPAPVRVGDAVRLNVEGLAQPLETRIERVSDRVDSETRTYEVRGPVQDPSRTLKAGSYVRADVVLESIESTPIVARSALRMRDGRNYVFRVRGDTVEQVPVRIGLANAEQVQILSGIESGSEVVIGEAVERMQDGQHIETAANVSAARREAAP
ncbi:MAG: efflux RND transporter periplasmic adaptor subunit [Deltaproteobacteria bacterium]|nr:MAG: efflux RND transporter periplasmic adaptor subunit [Deltaproteobacteria bacterium]